MNEARFCRLWARCVAGAERGADHNRDHNPGSHPGRNHGRHPGRDIERGGDRNLGCDTDRDAGRNPSQNSGRGAGRNPDHNPGRDADSNPGKNFGGDAGRNLDDGPGRDADYGAALFARLDAYYREPHRHYHNGGHIDDCLARLDLAYAQADGGVDDADAVELALWFHDVIYQLGAPDNEQRSAEWFAAQAAGHLPADFIDRVAGYILDTTHRGAPAAPGAKWVVDADLSGIGMDGESFGRDGDKIRREFAHLSDAEFARGQAGFLRGLLARERIYYTDFFRDLCEARARRNIESVLAGHAGAGAESPSPPPKSPSPPPPKSP
ncbi:MAG: hypothetical protein OXU62_07105 [Gammaproteobacteria bacterium]|nr:hypothetical protein [Gammaproteobacteria bacterium]